MWGRKQNQREEWQLQQLEAELFRALEASPEEINASANAPFLYQRLRARIEAETRRRAEAGRHWLSWLVIARQATPALAMVALLAIGTFWMFADKNAATLRNDGTGNQATVDLPGGVALSNDELLAALAGWDRQEVVAADSPATVATPAKEATKEQ